MANRLIKAIIPTIITSIFSFFSWIIPLAFAGAVVYSIIVDTIPSHRKKPIVLIYLLHCFFYFLSGVLGWELYLLMMHGHFDELDFSNLLIIGSFSLVYYHILLFINQYQYRD